MTPGRIKFLIALGSAIRNGAVKTIRQAMNFAEQQFGKIDKSFIDDIVKVFKKEGKTKKGDVVPIKKQEGIVRRPEEFATRKEYERYLDETLGPSDDVFGSPMKDDLLKEWDKVNAKNVTLSEADQDIADIQKSIDELDAAEAEADAFSILDDRTRDIRKGVVTGETSDLMKGLEDKITGIKKAADEMKDVADETPESFVDFWYAGTKARDPKVGMVRTAAREILEKNKVKIGGEDPIEVFRQIYGEKGLEAVDAVSDNLLDAQSYGEINTILRDNKLFDLVPKKTYGYDESVVTAEKIRKAKEQEAKQRQILEEFDPPDRTENAHGGLINILKL